MLNGKNRATHKIKFVRSKRTHVVEIIKHQIVLRYSARQQKVEHTHNKIVTARCTQRRLEVIARLR
jgi:hypothetical protein